MIVNIRPDGLESASFGRIRHIRDGHNNGMHFDLSKVRSLDLLENIECYLLTVTPIVGSNFKISIAFSSESELDLNADDRCYLSLTKFMLSNLTPDQTAKLMHQIYKSGKQSGRLEIKKRFKQLIDVDESSS